MLTGKLEYRAWLMANRTGAVSFQTLCLSRGWRGLEIPLLRAEPTVWHWPERLNTFTNTVQSPHLRMNRKHVRHCFVALFRVTLQVTQSGHST